MACLGLFSSIFVIFLAKVVLMVLQVNMLYVVAEEATSSTLRGSENDRHIHSLREHNLKQLKNEFDEDFMRNALSIPVPFTDGSCFIELYAGFVAKYIESNNREDILKLINQKVAMPISKILYRSMRNVVPKVASRSVTDDDFNHFEDLVAQKCNVGDRIRRSMVNVNNLVQDFASSNRGQLSDRVKGFASSNRGQLSNFVKDIGSNRGQLNDRVKGFASSSRGQLSNLVQDLVQDVGSNHGQSGNMLNNFEVGEVSGQSPEPKLVSGTFVGGETVKFLEQILSGNILVGENILPGERGKLVEKVLLDMNIPGGNLLLGERGKLVEKVLPDVNIPGRNLPGGNLLPGERGKLVKKVLPDMNIPGGNLLPGERGKLVKKVLPDMNIPGGNLLPGERGKFVEKVLPDIPGGNLLPGERGKLVEKVLPDMNIPGGNFFPGVNIFRRTPVV